MESAQSLEDLANGLQGLGHPMRIRALVLMEHTELSPSDIAIVLGNPIGVVSYHVRMLRDYGLVEEVRTEARRGALAHFYRRTELADRLIAKLTGELAVPNAGRAGAARRREQLAEWAQAAA
jgi:DNA-binding transcriptional ArsR family regulator